MNLAFIKPIRTEEEYESAIERMADLANSPAGSDERKEMELLYDLVEHYEDRHYKIDPPLPHEAIRFRMEQAGWDFDVIAGALGSKSRTKELLEGSRPPTADEVLLLNRKFSIPLESLLSKGLYSRRGHVKPPSKSGPILSTAVQKKIRWGISHGMTVEQLAALTALQPAVVKAAIQKMKRTGSSKFKTHSTSASAARKKPPSKREV
jgi:HTH-type transcriptional regulator/antitoxin HigA